MADSSNPTTFEGLVALINEWRVKVRDGKEALNNARVSVQKAREEISNLHRMLGREPSGTEIAEAKAKLQQKIAALEEKKVQLESSQSRVNELISKLIEIENPRTAVTKLNDDKPILLLPIRIETRFMTVKHVVKVEAVNSPVSGASDSVRESDILDERLPVIDDEKELWIRIFPDDIHVHTHETALTELEISAGEQFWNLLWNAGGDMETELGAWRGLASGRSSERAAWVAKVTTPTNISAIGTGAPVFPTGISLKTSSWTEPPVSKVLPDCFVVRLYRGNNWREVVGKAIPDPLQLNIDPNDGDVAYDQTNGNLLLPQAIRWLEDFEEAENVGMGIRVSLSASESVYGFDKILVLGVKSSADSSQAKSLLEELIDNHHYTSGGFAVVPQGTPTNNTGDASSGYTLFNTDKEVNYLTELKSPLFTIETDDHAKSDGQHLAESLGINYDNLQHVRYSDRFDIKEAMCMNHALWPSTLGYYMSQVMFPMFDKPTIKSTRNFFNQFVLGRGRIPSIKVGKQPYGIQPATVFSKWKYSGNDDRSVFLKGLHENVLSKMDEVWESLVSHIKHAGDPNTNPTDTFLDLITLHPASVEFYQRFTGGPWFMWNVFNFRQLVDFNTNFSLPQSEIAGQNRNDNFATRMNAAGFQSSPSARIFDFLYLKEEKYLDGPVIDRLGLSETRKIQQIANTGKNYIDWLIASNFTQIREEDFSSIGATPNPPPPQALLYLLLRHAYQLEFVQTAILALVNAGQLSSQALIDFELLNMTASGTLTAEQTALIQKEVEAEILAGMQSVLTLQVQNEFAGSAFTGAQLAREMNTRMNELRTNALQSRVSTIQAEVQNRTNSFQIAGSKADLLTTSFPNLTGSDTLEAYLNSLPPNSSEMEEFLEVKNALECIKGLPTARLELTMAEHLDLCNYRLDSWLYSLVTHRLNSQRINAAGYQKGIYLGGFGWIENLRPSKTGAVAITEVGLKIIANAEAIQYGNPSVKKNIIIIDTSSTPKARTNPDLSDPVLLGKDGLKIEYSKTLKSTSDKIVSKALSESLISKGDAPTGVLLRNAGGNQNAPVKKKASNVSRYVYLGSNHSTPIAFDEVQGHFVGVQPQDSGNKGYIHAPSINQATAAAILRAGYESHKSISGTPADAMAVNLSSSRVRKAMFFIEGIRNGQELAALLGYQFERSLHDNHTGMDQYIYDLRNLFPLVSGRVNSHPQNDDIGHKEAYNVINGLELVEAFRNSTNVNPWYGSVNLGTEVLTIEGEIKALEEILDAISDLLLAESVFQVAQGNPVRAGSTLEAMAKGAALQELEVLKTPRYSHVLTHRVGFQFDLTTGGADAWSLGETPRSAAEPHLNRWLADWLPNPAKICVNLIYTPLTPPNSNSITVKMDVGQLYLQPIDLFFLATENQNAGIYTELSARFSFVLRNSIVLSDDIQVEIQYMERMGFAADEFSLFELAQLFSAVKDIVGKGRALRPEDLLLSSDSHSIISASLAGGLSSANLKTRLDNTLLTLSALSTDIETQVNDYDTNPANIDAADLNLIRGYLLSAAQFDVPNCIPETGVVFNPETVTKLIGMGRRARAAIHSKFQKADALLDTYGSLATEKEKVTMLEDAAKAIFGRSFKVFPEFNQYDPAEMNRARTMPSYLDPNQTGNFGLEEWLQGISKVRKPMGSVLMADMLSEAIKGNAPGSFTISQLPLVTPPGSLQANYVEKWLGAKYELSYEIPGDNLSTLFRYPASFSESALQAGILVDEWVEEIPNPIAITGIALNYNNPDTEAPQSMLLCVKPEITGHWDWETLMQTLNETLGWAKKRAVDPDLLKTTLFAQLLPAIVAAVPTNDQTPGVDFGKNILQNSVHFDGPIVVIGPNDDPSYQ